MTIRVSKRLLKALAVLLLLIVLVACNGTAPSDTPAEDIPEDEVILAIGDLLIYVPAGPFTMGSTEDDALAREDEFPAHNVNLSGYYIYRHEVTNAQYKACVEAGDCTEPTDLGEGPSTEYDNPEFENNPVVGVNWYQAGEFCAWADARLPTEAEWEKAARGRYGDPYPWGADEPTCDLTNMAGCEPDEDIETYIVAQYPDGESEYEAQDMAGNVWEWTLDWYDEDYYLVSLNGNPLGPVDGDLKVVRGGSYENDVVDLRSAARLPLDPEDEFNNVGFRCVPVGLSQAANPVQPPICRDTYIPYCTPTDDDCTPRTGDNGGDPGNTPTGEVTHGGISCPNADGQMSFTIDVPEGAAPDDYIVSLGIYDYTCYETGIPGRLICYGHHVTQDSYQTLTVCAADDQNAGLIEGVELVTGGPSAAPAGQLVAFQAKAQAPAQQVQAFQPTAQPAQAQLVAYQPSQAAQAPTGGIQAFEFAAPNLQTAGPSGIDDYCPQGYLYNEITGDCEKPEDQDNCPEGWSYNPQTYQCQPDDQDGCPEGTSYTATAQGCTPDDGACPDGYYFDPETETCQPPGNNDGGGACPAGYYYNTEINCCSPIPGNNYECGDGYYFSAARNQCIPTDDYGCGPNLTYNPYEGGCVPDDYNDDDCEDGQYYDTRLQSCVDEETECPAGTVPTADGQGCEYQQPLNRPGTIQATYDGPECREPGYVMNEQGYCVPEGQDGEPGSCPDGSYYDTYLQQCISTGEDGCGPGYYYDETAQTCRPTDGPGSGCGNGYAFHAGLNCCAPTPGNDSTACLERDGGQTAGQPTIQSFASYTAPGTGYDYGQGYCDPGPDQDCPDGYYYDTGQQVCLRYNDGDCPEGYHNNTPDGSCAPIGATGALQSFQYVSLPSSPSLQTQTACPEGMSYNPYNGGCTPDEVTGYNDQCGDGYYYDYQLNYCVPVTCDGCALGYYYDSQQEACLPYEDNDQCPNGWYYDTGQESCVPYGGQTSNGCTTFTVYVPDCSVPTPTATPRCDDGYYWDPQYQSCLDESGRPGGGTTVNCSAYTGSATNQAACNSAGCTWTCTLFGGAGCLGGTCSP